MPDFISLTCPTCGAKLQITEDIERFSCGSCGNEHIIRRSGGIVTVAPIVEGLKEVKTGVDKTASELAIIRLEKELDVLKKQKAKITKDPDSYSTIFFLCSGFAIFLLIFILFILFMGPDISLSWLIPLFLLLAGGAYFSSRASIEANKINEMKFKMQIESANRVITEKEKELKRNQDLVNGQ